MSKDLPASVVRTVVPLVVGWLLSLAVVPRLGFTEAEVTQAVAAVLAGLWYIGWRVVELYVAPRFGALFIGLGVAAPSYGKHEAGRPPADAGHARAWLLTGLGTLAAILLLAAATAPSAVSQPRTPAHVQVIAAYDCNGELITVYGLERYRETSDGGEWVFQQDDGTVELQLHRIGNGAREGGQWTTYPTRSGGEGRRLFRDVGVPTWDAVRVVRDGVASSQALPTEGCPA
jgi:hypothetical protein